MKSFLCYWSENFRFSYLLVYEGKIKRYMVKRKET